MYIPTRLNRNREYIKHQRDLSLPLGIYQIYTPTGVFDVWLKQDINIKKYIYIYTFVLYLQTTSKGIFVVYMANTTVCLPHHGINAKPWYNFQTMV